MKPVAFIDLDDTLFQTRRKMGAVEDGDLAIASHALNGSHSYMSRTQAAMADWLVASTEAIPVTARGSEAFSRVTIPFTSYAIVANGAAILDADGKPNAEWQGKISAGLGRYSSHFLDLLEAGSRRAEELKVSIRAWSVMEGDLATYVVFKENEGDGSRLQEIAPLVTEEGWIRHHNGNNLALIPPVISKRLACEFLLARLLAENPARPVLGFGDSISDLSYLTLCDWWAAPRKSQLTDLTLEAAAQHAAPGLE